MGHCTLECGCCRQARGFDLDGRDESEEDKSELDSYFGFPNRGWYIRTKLASIWGLCYDNFDNPFDLIQESSKREQEQEIKEDWLVEDEFETATTVTEAS